MKRIYIFVCAAMLIFSNFSAQGAPEKYLGRKFTNLVNNQANRDKSSFSVLDTENKFMRNNLASKAIGDPTTSIPAEGWGMLWGPNNTDWFYTQTYTWNGQWISGTTITVYNEERKFVGTINIEIAEGRLVNVLKPTGTVTNNFFDSNETTSEIFIQEHEAGSEANDYAQSYKLYVYRTDGTKVTEFNATQANFIEIQENEFTSYTRLIIGNTDNLTFYKYDVYKKWWGELALEHSFDTIPYDNVMGMVGEIIMAYDIDGEPYYAISKYEKPYYTGEMDWATGFARQTENNTFITEVYNKNFENIKTLKVPVETTDEGYHAYGCGFLTNFDVSKGFFTGNDDFNFIVSKDYYEFSNDKDYFTFDVYNGNGEIVKNITTDADAEGFFYLDDIKGHETQLGFGHTNSKGEQSIDFVNLPSCEIAVTMPSTLEGGEISTSMNRYPKGDSYQYVISLNEAEKTPEGDMLALVGWYNTDLTLDHMVKFNLGPNGIFCDPYLSELNPYYIDTDDEIEYVYKANITHASGVGVDKYLNIADHEGKTIRQYAKDATKGIIAQVGYVNVSNKNKALGIFYYNEETYKYTLDFVDLPLTKFPNGGDGTEENPYIVSSVGDLMQVANEPTAHYKQGCNINMNNSNQDWTPIATFSGTYDGNDKVIENLTISDPMTPYIGLFNTLEENATISNLMFTNPRIEVNTNNQYVGILAGYAIASNVHNVHIYDAEIVSVDEYASPVVGGIIGESSFEGKITASSFNNGIINMPNATSVGGIAGDARTSLAIKACAASGTFTANSSLGGILGSQGMGVVVADCHADVELNAQNTVGGIVGYNGDRGEITHCIAEGTITATDNFANVGGIVGYLGENWDRKDSTVVVKQNVVALSEISIPNSENDTTTHGIIGYSIENTKLERNEKPYVELGLDSNYVSASLKMGGKANDVHGEAINEDKMDLTFFQSIGFAYGDSVAAPWVNGSGLPYLYIEDFEPVVPIEKVEISTDNNIFLTDGVISAQDAERIDIFAVSGQKVAGKAASEINVSHLNYGVYIVVTTNNNGQLFAKKMIIK